MEHILDEIRHLVERGTREVILIGQNSTDYGIDLYGRYALVDLLKALRDIEGLRWVRILYAYPDHFDDALIDEMKNNPKILPYIDIPIQHVADPVLKGMNRKTDRRAIESLITRLRSAMPDIAIRSTFLLGFPGETDEDFQEVLDFLEDYPLERAGAFAYSREEGTPAAAMADQVADDVKEARVDAFMAAQMDQSERLMEKQVGRTLEVLVTEITEEGAIGRSYLDAPDIDGMVSIYTDENLAVGDFIKVEITESTAYDLGGDYIEHCK